MNEDDEKTQTTADEFRQFQQAFDEWRRFFGIEDYSVVFSHEDIEENFAQLQSNYRAANATAIFGKTLPKWQHERLNIPRTAFHEACELLLSPLVCLANARFNIDEADIERQTHRIIRVLEHVLYDQRAAHSCAEKETAARPGAHLVGDVENLDAG